MKFQLKTISLESIDEALSKVSLYRSLNKPDEAESICRDILEVDADNQQALRLLGLTITDQFTGEHQDRFNEAKAIFEKLTARFEALYNQGVLYERRAKAQLLAGRLPKTTIPLFEKAIALFEEAQTIHPDKNDDAILRQNRCVRMLRANFTPEELEQEEEVNPLDAHNAHPF